MTLVAKRNMLRWELPAGVAKNGESLEETAQREAWEETGLCITIREIVAICWHHSRELNKGWMGAIYRGDLPSTKSTDDFMVIADNAFAKGKFNFKLTPNFYNTWKLEKVDFDAIQRKCDSRSLSTVHESVIAAGFVDWKKIPPERMHPQHRKLLENWKDGPQFIAFLIADADKDRDFYEPSARLYYSF